MKRECIFAVAAAIISGGVCAADVEIDFSAETGPVKDVHSAGQPPLQGWAGTNMFHYLREAGIRYSRLHDVGGPFGGNRFVDIPNVFRDFDADENDPESYDFAFTDILIRGLVEAGVEPFYRLGVTIENSFDVRPYRIFPPKDYAKWARICEHVIRHYTEGWAGGFKYRIEYWEIWNEPDLFQTVDDPESFLRCPMWRAPFDEYVKFYGVVAPYLKSKFPHLKIGGYAGCGFTVATAAAGHRRRGEYESRAEFARRFLDAVKSNGWPLDFFSYHSYDTAANIARQIEYGQALLEERGLGGVETILDEWLCRDYRSGSAMQAAETAATLAAMQNSSLGKAMIYDAKCGLGAYSPLFDPVKRRPRKAYYAFKAFEELKRLGTAVRASAASTNLFVAAAKGPGGRAALVANVSDERAEVRFAAPGGALAVEECVVTDASRTWEACGWAGGLPPRSFALVRFADGGAEAPAAATVVSGALDGDGGDPRIFRGDETHAYRDPAAVYHDGTFHLYFTLVRIEEDGGVYSYTAQSESRDMRRWTEPQIITPRDRSLNYSSPGNVIRFGGEWVMCLQTYPRPGNTVEDMPRYGDETSRIFTMRSKDLRHWGKPELLKVKGPDVAEAAMGRMIDPFLVEDSHEPGKWWCFFKQRGASMAWSRDLKEWHFEGRTLAGENVCVVKDGAGGYVMLHSPRNGIGVKTSDDAVNWRSEPTVYSPPGQADWPWARGRLTAAFALDARDIPGFGCWLVFFHGSGPLTETEGDFDRNSSIGVVRGETAFGRLHFFGQ